ncbi:3-hydroxyacyl-CoA dehydrogenase NAD-binding domain-containing protein [Pandoraea sputorum]|uniref:Probable 3-hydroxybutyryl-CoA dehydrogenase n=1 Tax=Pandoraea sputorum TaxID=93222 RepID=A0A239SHP0_9BURK|nr:3-hydroxyacyl-CoA dehydrogenase NAD-binding domain-containing protein [Pandoraea sputorum]AJC17007.1 3-hydroxyacyl-CoA dehydrogenase [Pandoraea sputorum]SNU84927.1 Probable 3-hydroxybutyryl-CoA dehydrogenase [Pandoraea sputorum]VVD81211.1 3-hydroxyacyl-CoA dehydrogenase [Pandoraea sputorum]VVE75718.1 3-hydroxyacyl-CoA dehydrogenase [Pandoraea sputorum]BET10079.1 3-hydroxyacyl-CoA dehydrogenase NAD-binding domain-containing protein [Pandoraea sputorum]
MKYDNIEQVAVIGTGVIGASWAAYFLARGLRVSAWDPAPGARERLREAVDAHWPTLIRIGLTTGATRDSLTFHDTLDAALEGADFVQESGPEREDLKQDLFRKMDDALPPSVVIASSSSGLLMSRVQSVCAHPERVVLGHPFNPPHLIPLVEVIGGEQSSQTAIDTAMQFYRAIGKRAIHVRKEVKGHIANRLQAALWREAIHLVDTGVASVADIDDAIAYGPGLRWAALGPFLNLHLSGGAGGIAHLLEHLGPPIESWWADLGAPVLTDDLKARITAGVEAELAGRGNARLEAQRDAVILGILASKP